MSHNVGRRDDGVSERERERQTLSSTDGSKLNKGSRRRRTKKKKNKKRKKL